MTTRMNFKSRRDQRRKDAEARQAEYDKLTMQQMYVKSEKWVADSKIKLDKKPKGE